jgi:hypothetical protein
MEFWDAMFVFALVVIPLWCVVVVAAKRLISRITERSIQSPRGAAVGRRAAAAPAVAATILVTLSNNRQPSSEAPNAQE